MNTRYLTISWSVSRGRDTAGYTICKLTDNASRTAYKTCGGGYDMMGTVVGDWLQKTYQDRLLAIKKRAHYIVDQDGCRAESVAATNLYGMCHHISRQVAHPARDYKSATPPRINLDGGCGINSMERIAKAIGIQLSATVNRRGHVTGYMVTDYGSAKALEAARKVRS